MYMVSTPNSKILVLNEILLYLEPMEGVEVDKVGDGHSSHSGLTTAVEGGQALCSSLGITKELSNIYLHYQKKHCGEWTP